MNKILLISILATAFLYGCSVEPNDTVLKSGIGAVLESKEISHEGKLLNFDYTDNNTDETLIIKATDTIFGGFNLVKPFYSIENISGVDQLITTRFLFEGNESVAKIYQLIEDIPYQVEVDDTIIPQCDQKFTVLNDEFTLEECYEKEFIGEFCTYIEKEECKSGKAMSHIETQYRDEWQEITLIKPRVKVSEKFVPEKFISQKETEVLIKAGETKYFMAEIGVEPHTTSEFYIEAFGDKGAYGLLDPLINTDWDFRKKLTLNNADQAEEFTDEVIVVNLRPDENQDVYDNTQADMDDTVFTDCDGTTLLNFHQEGVVDKNASTTMWVQVPTVDASSATDCIYMYFGNDTATDTRNSTSTYSAEHSVVWHFDDSGQELVDDYTSNQFNLTLNNTPSRNATGTISGSVAFEKAASEWAENTNLLDASYDGLTLSTWVYRPDVWSSAKTRNEDMMNKQNIVTNYRERFFFFWQQSSGGLGSGIQDQDGTFKSCITSKVNWPANTWSHVVTTNSATSDAVYIYVNGSLTDGCSNTATTWDAIPAGSNSNFVLNRFIPGTQYSDMSWDETKFFIDVEKTQDWAKFIFLSESHNLITYGALETKTIYSDAELKVKGGAKLQIKGGAKLQIK